MTFVAPSMTALKALLQYGCCHEVKYHFNVLYLSIVVILTMTSVRTCLNF